MTPNERIVAAAWDALYGVYWVPGNPGECLAAVRVVVERALGLRERHFYDVWVRERIETAFENEFARSPVARDAERSLTNRGWAVPFSDRKPGDLLFDWTAAHRQEWGTTLGHVGIYMGPLPGSGREGVMENTESPTRGLRRLWRDKGALVTTAVALTPLEQFIIPNVQNQGMPTRVIRIPG